MTSSRQPGVRLHCPRSGFAAGMDSGVGLKGTASRSAARTGVRIGGEQVPTTAYRRTPRSSRRAGAPHPSPRAQCDRQRVGRTLCPASPGNAAPRAEDPDLIADGKVRGGRCRRAKRLEVGRVGLGGGRAQRKALHDALDAPVSPAVEEVGRRSCSRGNARSHGLQTGPSRTPWRGRGMTAARCRRSRVEDGPEGWRRVARRRHPRRRKVRGVPSRPRAETCRPADRP